ncbi:MAG: flagellar biosynthetic protein FliR [Desulfovibrio sp.]|nr:MAG: flagellar biosynthetic protein FliR [Desulfovibrio sp.]
MDPFAFDPATVLSLILTFIRVSILLFLLPFYGGDTIPGPVKAALCLVMTLAVWPQLSFPGELMPGHPLLLLFMVAGELVMGLVMGLMVRFIFAAVQTGGQIIGFQMGFAMVNIVDPVTGVSEAVTAHFLYMVTLLTFMVLNGHLMLLHALAQSFHVIEPGGLLLNSTLAGTVIDFSNIMFTLAAKVAAPVMAALFLVDLALALVGRAAPQMNLMMLGFPLKISVGFLFIGMLFSLLSMYVKDFISGFEPMFFELLSMGR